MFSAFTADGDVIRVGVEYLRIVSWSFLGSGIVFVSSSMFQALGNTIPPLITSFGRILFVAIPILVLAQGPGFELKAIWYLSAAGVFLQMAMNLVLLERELRLKLPIGAAGQPSVSA